MEKQDIVIVRYGHREVRDYRVTGHCGLVARAFGAKKMIVCGEKDESLVTTIAGVNKTWGGKFGVEFSDSWRSSVTKLKKEGYKIVHLTMYGTPVQEAEKNLLAEKKIAIIIGSQKVERPVYLEADYNIGVTSQPHSEIAALAVFLDRVQQGKELEKIFSGAERRIVPQERGKKVLNPKEK
ncbi:MAG: tRNA (cytidine(56)-2'-O)-methyltransferase [archaeon]|jgi:tRNA (cytidine56-2'-O)-methyltransferase